MTDPGDVELEWIRARKLAQLQETLRQRETAPMAAGPVALTDATFWDAIRAAPVALVDFWAAWCGPCRIVAPSVEALAKAHAGRLTVGKVNVDENPAIPAQFGIQSIPTLLVFKGGKLVDSVIGAVSRESLERLVQPWL